MPISINVGEIMANSAALLNDQARAVYTNAVQLPYLKMAYDDLRQELEDNNVPVVNRTSEEFTITTAMTDIGGPTGPALPLDLIEPLDCWERTAGTTSDYLLMDKRQFLPKTQILVPYLQVWAWMDQMVKFIGATNNLNVKLDYIGDPLGAILNENTQIRVYNTGNFLKYRNAALCAEFIGENPERAESLNNNASRALNTLLSITVKGAQAITTRRRPFRTRGRSVFGYQ